ncbi:hypothetical protein PHYBLDRAFT_139517 [Phycomyces blakesleeanus NRRL 1555(-)]|uniref:Uncharacterized protein n=1 Tax=Phycomyces blakesleeanus (strain ATCC 8743b / DSM 1359 / FGSC 10004 / NBRC 33097 / NRRL 1555) TaxID=763407 RepID=A0A162V296_PHYB8|nr:hypothetical protein PHYBLDRAFT_139517 [Phycomyces blakesleeanus NRRL 1555(-)]OAD79482.1 hypothetical protein PHYBLDRAFT_139517 [Phycomyces blakesleeanus NRRL 1555(-)]|eukprot:XP_018297522.1 hypothetical protein PHYBLDRAFT_139517 [Phycomyces blakesleeanus NRRL 1555(-)]
MGPRTNINQNACTNGSASRPLINAVNTDCIGLSNPMIAPRPDNISIPVSEFNDVISLLATLNDKMTAVSSNVSELKIQCQVGAQSTDMQAVLDSDMSSQDIISSSRHPKISFNKNLASDFMLYIRCQPVAAMVPPKGLCGICCK